MKYLRSEVVQGLLQSDKNRKARLEEEFEAAKASLAELNQKAWDDFEVWKTNVDELIQSVLDLSVPPTNEVYVQTCKKPGDLPYRLADLGPSNYDLKRANEKVESTYQALVNHGPSDLTIFLSGVDDEYVTDAGVRGAGFDHQGLGRIVMIGKEPLGD